MSQFFAREVAAERGRVTQGLPALSPEQRAITDYRKRQRIKADAAAKEAETKEQDAIAPDGKRPRDVKEAAGMYLDPSVVMQRLTKLTKRLYFERSVYDDNRMGIYLLTSDPENPKQYITAFHCNQPVPELTLMDGPRVKLMGWKEVGKRLIKMGLITRTAFDVTFGPGVQTRLWQLKTT